MFYEIVTSTLWTVVANLCNTEIKREKWFILFQLLLLDGHIEMLNVNLFQELFIRIKISSQQLVCWIHTTANFEILNKIQKPISDKLSLLRILKCWTQKTLGESLNNGTVSNIWKERFKWNVAEKTDTLIQSLKG